jgi:hypothetical protein
VYIPLWALMVVLVLCIWVVATRASRNYAQSIDVALSQAVRDLNTKTDRLGEDVRSEINELQRETEVVADNLETSLDSLKINLGFVTEEEGPNGLTTSIAAKLETLGERIQQLEEMVCVAKARCRKCDNIFIIMPATKHLYCERCHIHFGDIKMVLFEHPDDMHENLEWIHKDGFERNLLLSYLRRDIKNKYPRALANIPISSDDSL